jgi:hypothetical protein
MSFALAAPRAALINSRLYFSMLVIREHRMRARGQVGLC